LIYFLAYFILRYWSYRSEQQTVIYIEKIFESGSIITHFFYYFCCMQDCDLSLLRNDNVHACCGFILQYHHTVLSSFVIIIDVQSADLGHLHQSSAAVPTIGEANRRRETKKK
jgi:hypothetical protein